MIFVEMFTKGQLVRTQARRIPYFDRTKTVRLISPHRIDAGRAGKDESQRHTVTAGNGIGVVTDKVAVDAIVTLVLQGCDHTIALFIQHRNVQRHTHVEQTFSAQSRYSALQTRIIEAIGQRIDNVAHTRSQFIRKSDAPPTLLCERIHRCVQIASRLESSEQRSARSSSRRRIINDGRFAEAAKETAAALCRIGRREAINAERHFNQIKPARIWLLTHIFNIVGSFDLLSCRYHFDVAQHRFIARQIACRRARLQQKKQQSKSCEEQG